MCKATLEWFKVIIGDSTSLSRHSRKDRNQYFNCLEKIILASRNRLARLSLTDHEQVIAAGLRGRQSGKLYSGMIYAVQVTVFSGFYKEEEGCELIDFTAACDPEPGSPTYADAYRYLGRSLTTYGNYA